MAKNFSELRGKMSPDAQARAAARAEVMLKELTLCRKSGLADRCDQLDPSASQPAGVALCDLASRVGEADQLRP